MGLSLGGEMGLSLGVKWSIIRGEMGLSLGVKWVYH